MSDELRETSDGLSERLIAMAEEDARLRDELLRDGSLFEGYNPRMAGLHARNAGALSAIVEEVGWPGRTLAGEKGAAAAWRMLQHHRQPGGAERVSLQASRRGATAPSSTGIGTAG